MSGRSSQRKGRRAERDDIRGWECDGYTVKDWRSLEAAGQTHGIDYSIETQFDGVAFQRKSGKRPNVLAAFGEVWDATRGKPFMPVAHITQDYGRDVAVLDWLDFKVLLLKAMPPRGKGVKG